MGSDNGQTLHFCPFCDQMSIVIPMFLQSTIYNPHFNKQKCSQNNPYQTFNNQTYRILAQICAMHVLSCNWSFYNVDL